MSSPSIGHDDPMNGNLPTPCLVVDLDILDDNIDRMATSAAARSIAVRPHVKTHKSPAIAQRQLAAGATGLTVATLSEAEVFAVAGFRDIFIAYPLWVDQAQGARLSELLEIVTLTIGVDSAEGARALAAQLSIDQRAQMRVLIEIDSGQHRTGVPAEQAGTLAEQAEHAGLRVQGVFTFPGHSYSPGTQTRVAGDEAAALEQAAQSLVTHGVEPRVISGGSTPSAAAVSADAMTEMRPGVYVFGDAQQWELGTTTPERIALSCLATVVSHAGGNVILDSGSKALGADRAGWATGFGRLLDHHEARITQLSEHHAVVAWGSDSPVPERGSRVRVVPNHVCNSVNLADELVVVENAAVIDRWPVSARGANT